MALVITGTSNIASSGGATLIVFNPPQEMKRAAVRAIADLAKAAADEGAELLVLPERALTGLADPAGSAVALDGPAVADNLADKAAGDERMTALIEELTSDRTQLEELARAYGEKLFTLKEWTTARAPIESRIRSAERELHQLTNTDAITGLVGNGEALCNQWSGLILDRQHAIIRAVLDHAVIAPGSPKATKLDPERVQPVWQF